MSRNYHNREETSESDDDDENYAALDEEDMRIAQQIYILERGIKKKVRRIARQGQKVNTQKKVKHTLTTNYNQAIS